MDIIDGNILRTLIAIIELVEFAFPAESYVWLFGNCHTNNPMLDYKLFLIQFSDDYNSMKTHYRRKNDSAFSSNCNCQKTGLILIIYSLKTCIS